MGHEEEPRERKAFRQYKHPKQSAQEVSNTPWDFSLFGYL